MKTKLSFSGAVIIMLLTSWITPATTQKSFSGLSVEKTDQINPEFEFFRTHRQAQGIMTTWGLTINQGVAGFIVQKTYEDPNDPYSNWENICAIPCGAGRSFKHHDLNVSPGFISYRVIAYLQSGGSMMSLTSTVHVVSH
jgi:hypothetical protein